MNFKEILNFLTGKTSRRKAARDAAQAAQDAAAKQLTGLPGGKPTSAELDAAGARAVNRPKVTFESLPDEIATEVMKQRRADARRQLKEGVEPGLKGLRVWPKPGAVPGPQPSSKVPEIDPKEVDLIIGTMYDVQSSNVHSIGMRIDQPGARTGLLMVRYLATLQGGVRAGPGSLYGYYDVPVTLFRELQHAASKGIFIWDNVRVRGTISGHRYRYELLGINSQYAGGRMHDQYVPRQAAVLRGKPGEHYIKRSFTTYQMSPGGREMKPVTIYSQLTPQQASMRGPNPSRGPGVQGLRFEANRQGGME